MSNSKTHNRLAQESSPYLLQHQYNPVAWYPWGAEAFNLAVTTNRPIFLSIGYSTCYWCHVMEKESFEDQQVADLLNQSFVCIKVDREERPDVDQLYMDVAVGLTGHGGWPLSVFLTPQLKPFFAGTYFNKNAFLALLSQIAAAWRERHAELSHSAHEISQALFSSHTPASLPVGEELFARAAQHLETTFDHQHGGFGAEPKFPPSMQLAFLLRMYQRQGRPEHLQMVLHTLDRMGRGGIYDHLAGGFARYATDTAWLIPHFEKMLYDNALLLRVYLEAFKVSGQSFLRTVAEETLQYVCQELQSPTGGFYSAQDAGEVGAEGEYYLWQQRQVEEVLQGSKIDEFCAMFEVNAEGNFEHGGNVLHLADAASWNERAQPQISKQRALLLRERKLRIAPRLDDKIITSWNALLVSALCKAGEYLASESYLQLARETLLFIKDNLISAEGLHRCFCKGRITAMATSEDYSFLIEALLNMHRADKDAEWLDWAKGLQREQIDLFWDPQGAALFFSRSEELIFRKKEFADNATPSANFVALSNLIRLHVFHEQNDLRERVEQMWESCSETLSHYPWACCSGLNALMLWLDGRFCSGPECDLQKLNKLML